MIAVFVTIISLGPDAWTEIDAKVLKTEIKIFRSGGPPTWDLYVTAGYDVAGERYENTLRVFSDQKRGVTEAEQGKWPPGRTFTIYHHPDTPGVASLVQDGGREALAATAAILTPLVIFFGVLIAIVVRRRARSG